jgi:6-phosphogluconolactonase
MTHTEVAAAVARAFDSTARTAITERGRFVCAVPGGSVATEVFPALARLNLPWQSVHIFLADERFVPPESLESNVRLVRDYWANRTSPPGPVLHAMPTEGMAIDAAARQAEHELTALIGRPPVFDLVILGVGPDGHVASLFPDHPALTCTDRWVLPIEDAPKPPPRRLTLSLPSLTAARELWIVAFGHEKAAAIADAQSVFPPPQPLATVVHSGAPVRWFLDAGAEGTPR